MLAIVQKRALALMGASHPGPSLCWAADAGGQGTTWHGLCAVLGSLLGLWQAPCCHPSRSPQPL